MSKLRWKVRTTERMKIPLACVDTKLSECKLQKFSYGSKSINQRPPLTWPSYLVNTSIFIQIKDMLIVHKPLALTMPDTWQAAIQRSTIAFTKPCVQPLDGQERLLVIHGLVFVSLPLLCLQLGTFVHCSNVYRSVQKKGYSEFRIQKHNKNMRSETAATQKVKRDLIRFG